MLSQLLPISLGLLCAVAIAVAGRCSGFEKDRSFYPTVLIVIASYYLLFAAMANEAIIAESLGLAMFSGIALVGAFLAPWLVGAGIILHGVFDLTHSHFIDNRGVPSWWAAFCATVDFALGLWVIYISRKRA
jgi:hypothetical protein